MNIAKFLAIFGGSSLTVGVMIILLIWKTPKTQDDKANEMAWAFVVIGGIMLAGAVIINDQGGLRLP